MKKRAVVLFLVFLAGISLGAGVCIAQNNPYEIDDTCYPAYVEAEALIGKPEFAEYLGRFEILAKLVEDSKALTLADVIRLKDAIRRDDPSLTDSCLELALKSSLESGYLQYYFYSYYLAAISYFNKDIKSRTLEILDHMREDAELMDNDYGRWYCSSTLGDFYLASCKIELARKHFQEALDVHAKTDDPTIKKQPTSKLYASVASTYEYDAPERDYNLDQALATAFYPSDSLRVYFYRLCQAALAKDENQYCRYRKLCDDSYYLDRAHRRGSKLVNMTDLAIAGNWEEFSSLKRGVSNLEDLCYLCSLTKVYGNIDECASIYDLILRKVNNMNDNEIGSILDDLSLQMENSRLNQLTLDQKAWYNRILALTVLVLLIAAVLVAVLSYSYLTKMRRIKRKAEAVNNMKTRFIRNINHEIRTPLNAIVGFTQLLTSDDELSDEDRLRYGGYIAENSAILMKLIDDILDVSDAENDESILTTKRYNVDEMCANAMGAVDTVEPSSRDSNSDIH